jgi:hypothetical protein
MELLGPERDPQLGLKCTHDMSATWSNPENIYSLRVLPPRDPKATTNISFSEKAILSSVHHLVLTLDQLLIRATK